MVTPATSAPPTDDPAGHDIGDDSGAMCRPPPTGSVDCHADVADAPATTPTGGSGAATAPTTRPATTSATTPAWMWSMPPTTPTGGSGVGHGADDPAGHDAGDDSGRHGHGGRRLIE